MWEGGTFLRMDQRPQERRGPRFLGQYLSSINTMSPRRRRDITMTSQGIRKRRTCTPTISGLGTIRDAKIRTIVWIIRGNTGDLRADLGAVTCGISMAGTARGSGLGDFILALHPMILLTAMIGTGVRIRS